MNIWTVSYTVVLYQWSPFRNRILYPVYRKSGLNCAVTDSDSHSLCNFLCAMVFSEKKSVLTSIKPVWIWNGLINLELLCKQCYLAWISMQTNIIIGFYSLYSLVFIFNAHVNLENKFKLFNVWQTRSLTTWLESSSWPQLWLSVPNSVVFISLEINSWKRSLNAQWWAGCSACDPLPRAGLYYSTYHTPRKWMFTSLAPSLDLLQNRSLSYSHLNF